MYPAEKIVNHLSFSPFTTSLFDNAIIFLTPENLHWKYIHEEKNVKCFSHRDWL